MQINGGFERMDGGTGLAGLGDTSGDAQIEWYDVVGKMRKCGADLTQAYYNLADVYELAVEAGQEGTWNAVANDLTTKIQEFNLAADGLNIFSFAYDGGPINKAGLQALPAVIGGISVGAALLIIAAAYVAIDAANAFYSTLTGKPAPKSNFEKTGDLLIWAAIIAGMFFLGGKYIDKKA